MVVRSLIAAIALAAVACGSSPTAPTEVSRSTLVAAPTTVVIDGRTLTLSTTLWRDFMPIVPPGGNPLIGVFRIQSADGSTVPASVSADMCWIIRDEEVWSGPVAEERARRDTAPNYEVVARNGPKWDVNVKLDVVVQLRGGTGSVLLRAPNQTLIGVW